MAGSDASADDPGPPVSLAPAWPGAARMFVVAGGGALGALARYGLAVALPTAAGGFPWATFLTNVSGCLCLGLLTGTLGPSTSGAYLFLGVGVLGGFTTFSTYAVEADRLLRDGSVVSSAAYLAGTPVAAFSAVAAGMLLGGTAVRRGRPG